MSGLRQYEVVEHVSLQDGWVVQIRKRKKGKNAGQLYVWISPQKRLIYTMIFGSVE
jgi:hypothetical protein